MIFDKNENTFPSASHREVWWWAVGLVPPIDSLTNEVKSKCSPDVLEGCYQWYDYFNELCEDMYNHINEYAPSSARQYRDILECISAHGKIQGNKITWDINDWEAYAARLNKSKAYAAKGSTLNHCLKAFERTGLRCKRTENTVTFSYDKYPKIFYAMKTMENSPDIKNTPARHHFAHCEFRQLFKSYSANYDELLRRASDDSLYIAHTIHDFAKSLKIQRYIHFGIIKYKYKGVRVLDLNLYGDEYPTLRINLGTFANPHADIISDEYYKVLLSCDKNVQDILMRNPINCNDESHKHQNVIINGQKEQICPYVKIRINPFREDTDALINLITARKASIEQHYS